MAKNDPREQVEAAFAAANEALDELHNLGHGLVDLALNKLDELVRAGKEQVLAKLEEQFGESPVEREKVDVNLFDRYKRDVVRYQNTLIPSGKESKWADITPDNYPFEVLKMKWETLPEEYKSGADNWGTDNVKE